jgi:hypothetical protein
MLGIIDSITATELATSIRESALTYPILLSTHLTAIGLFGGLILMTDLRLLGVVLTNRPAMQVINALRPWKALGFIILVTCGSLLGMSKLSTYSPNPYFQGKLTLLTLVGVHALVFRKSVYHNPDLDKGPLPGAAKAAGVVSLCLWVGLVTCGRMIGYWE